MNKIQSLYRSYLKKFANSSRVKEAIENTPSDYWEKVLTQRASDGVPMGSRYDYTKEELNTILRSANWKEDNHSSISAPAVGFSAEIPGLFGLIEVSKLPSNTKLELVDPKNTGKVEVHVKDSSVDMPNVDKTFIILGPDGDKEVVWTFFPGDPIMPSQVAAEGMAGKEVTAQEAKDMGFEWAKL
jgi:hypothetical protein